MDLIEDDYRPEITSQSLAELKKLTKWQKCNQGNWSTIIGGWAVWAYYPKGFGSRDIDLILPEEDKLKVEIIENYFSENDIEKHNKDPFGEDHYYSKKITFEGGDDEVVFDLFYPEKPRPDDENLGVNVDWKWAFNYCLQYSLDEEVFINIPVPELLLPLKIVAVLSRIKEMETKADTRRRRSKIWKDYYDIANIIKHVSLTTESLESHMSSIGIGEKLRNSFLDGYIARSDTLDKVGITLPKISEMIPILKLKND